MKKLSICMLIFFCACLYAQNLSPFSNMRHSSVDSNGNLHLRFDTTAELADSYQLHYTTAQQWQEADLTQIGDGVFEALVPYNFGDRLRYRCKAVFEAMDQNISYLHPAWLEQDSFPLELGTQALIANDPSGDLLQSENPDLDITASYLAASESRIYRSMQNLSGAYSLMQSLTSYNIYISALINPETLADSVAYAMIYTYNIPMVISPGLYKINIDLTSLPSYERIGDIQSIVADNTLQMSCLMSDLINDPDFGAWPNSTNTLITTDITLNVGIDLVNQVPEFFFGDYGAQGMIEYKNLVYEVAENTLPSLKIVAYDAVSGAIELLYIDAEGDFPLQATHTIPTSAGFMDMDMNPIYNPDGSISFFENASKESSFTVSDNLIDFVVAYPPVSNADDTSPAAPALDILFTNPLRAGSSSCQLNLKGLKAESATLSLYNLRGQKLQEIAQIPTAKSLETITWSGSAYQALPQGIYLLRLQQAGHSVTRKITIIR